jgi:hypothetical protein
LHAELLAKIIKAGCECVYFHPVVSIGNCWSISLLQQYHHLFHHDATILGVALLYNAPSSISVIIIGKTASVCRNDLSTQCSNLAKRMETNVPQARDILSNSTNCEFPHKSDTIARRVC